MWEKRRGIEGWQFQRNQSREIARMGVVRSTGNECPAAKIELIPGSCGPKGFGIGIHALGEFDQLVAPRQPADGVLRYAEVIGLTLRKDPRPWRSIIWTSGGSTVGRVGPCVIRSHLSQLELAIVDNSKVCG